MLDNLHSLTCLTLPFCVAGIACLLDLPSLALPANLPASSYMSAWPRLPSPAFACKDRRPNNLASFACMPFLTALATPPCLPAGFDLPDFSSPGAAWSGRACLLSCLSSSSHLATAPCLACLTCPRPSAWFVMYALPRLRDRLASPAFMPDRLPSCLSEGLPDLSCLPSCMLV